MPFVRVVRPARDGRAGLFLRARAPAGGLTAMNKQDYLVLSLKKKACSRLDNAFR